MGSETAYLKKWKRARLLWFITIAFAGVFLLAALWMLLVWQFSASYVSRLPAEYELAKEHSDCISIVRGSHYVIGPHISLVSASGEYVVGFAELAKYEWDQEPGDVSGYFILSTTDGTVTRGMTETECQDTLRAHGKEWPKLVHPDTWRLWHFGF